MAAGGRLTQSPIRRPGNQMPDAAAAGPDEAPDDSHDEGSEWAAPIARNLPSVGAEQTKEPLGAVTGSTDASAEGIGPVRSNTPMYKVDHIGRHVRSSKLRHAWTLFLAGEAREVKVELEHSRLSGKKKVLIDGKLVFSTKEKRLCWSWEHPGSKALISLHSENGNHSLRCQEPEAEPATAAEAPIATKQDDGATSDQRSSRRSGQSPEERSSTTAGEASVEAFTFALPEEDGAAGTEAEEAEAAVAEEAKPGLPTRTKSDLLHSNPGSSADEVGHGCAAACPSAPSGNIAEETARLHALLGVRDAQIAALQGELRRCALGAKDGASKAVLEDLPPPSDTKGEQFPLRSQQVQTPPRQLLPPPQPQGQAGAQHFLIAELPTQPVPRLGEAFTPPQRARPASGNVSPGVGGSTSEPTPAGKATTQENPGWDDIDHEELDVTRRHVVGSSGAASTAAALASADGSAAESPESRPSPAMPRYKEVATPRRYPAVAVQVEAVETPRVRGRAGSMPPAYAFLPSRHHGSSCSSGRPERLLSVPPAPRSSSVHTPQRTPWRQSPGTPGPAHRRSVTPRRDAMPLQVQMALTPAQHCRQAVSPGPCSRAAMGMPGGQGQLWQGPGLKAAPQLQGWPAPVPGVRQQSRIGGIHPAAHSPVVLLPPPQPGLIPGGQSPLAPSPMQPCHAVAGGFPMHNARFQTAPPAWAPVYAAPRDAVS
eukprot:TRINITY_DN108859_c0_g1_i1.p1 TRINITY_DN108859_c0_g1~~TRINITY_DN108859_c0_g1_i1.p1  ORF type:complete len:732 (+),score=144.58 TRINITY_DN108859_c0_g1_i1:66-2198(+)